MVAMRYRLSGKFVPKGPGVALSSMIIPIAHCQRIRGIHIGYIGEFAPLFITQNVSQLQQLYIWHIHVSSDNGTRTKKVLMMVKPFKMKDWITL